MSGLVGPQPRRFRRRDARAPAVRVARVAAALAVLSTGGLVIALTTGAPDPGWAERSYAAVMTALMMTALVGALMVPRRMSVPTTFESLLQPIPPEQDSSFRGLLAMEQVVRFGGMTAGDFHSRTRPVLAAIAEHRLAAFGIRLDDPGDAIRAEDKLGPELYAMIRPGVPMPGDRAAPGVPVEVIERAVDSLERMR